MELNRWALTSSRTACQRPPLQTLCKSRTACCPACHAQHVGAQCLSYSATGTFQTFESGPSPHPSPPQMQVTPCPALLCSADNPADLRAVRSAAAGDTRPLCYGAFSGNIRVAGADVAALTKAAAAAAAGGDGDGRRGLKCKHSSSSTTGEGEQQQRRQRSGSGWDSALAGIEAAGQPQHELAGGDDKSAGRDGSSRSESEGEGQELESSEKQSESSQSESESESESHDSLFDDSSSSSGESDLEGKSEGGGERGSESEDGVGSRREHLFGSVTGGSARGAAVAAAAGSDTDQDPADTASPAATKAACTGDNAAAAAVQESEEPRQQRKRPRRNTSRLSCTAPTGTAAAAAGSQAAEDDATTQQQQQQQVAVEEVCHDDVMLSEGDINPSWVRPGDARLLVVCNKFETGTYSASRWEHDMLGNDRGC